MRLFEYDAKQILQDEGLPVPRSLLVNHVTDIPKTIQQIGLPLVLKAQTLIGGRGKSGGIKIIHSIQEAESWFDGKMGTYLNGKRIESILAEELVLFETEYYLSFTLDTEEKEIKILFSSYGGVHVEEANDSSSMFTYRIPIQNGLEDFRLIEILSQAKVPIEYRTNFTKMIQKMYKVFWKYDCELLEINPFVITKEGQLHILDVHLYIDDNAIPRQMKPKEIIENMPKVYPQSWYKINYGFDFVMLNPEGTVGLITTGAGLTMATMDELSNKGIKPINFSDVRSGQLRGDPSRIVLMLEKFKECKNIHYIFVSIFAGITDLAEFVETLLLAKNQVDFPKEVEWIIRLEGNNFHKAKNILENTGLFVTNSLDESIQRMEEGDVNR